jgi:hypothetical protein
MVGGAAAVLLVAVAVVVVPIFIVVLPVLALCHRL